MCAWKHVVLTLCGLSMMGTASIGAAAEAKDAGKVLRHAVFFGFKEGTSDAEIKKVEEAFAALPGKIDAIKRYQAGKNISPLGLDDGLTHCFLLTFADEAGRAVYLPHPDHKAFGAGLGPNLEKVFVIDYWGKAEKNRTDRELKHALFVNFKESATTEEVKAAEEAIAQLASQCDAVKAFEWGTNNSPEKHDAGFTHCFMFTFADEASYHKYAELPERAAVVEKVRGSVEKARIFDFWTKDATGGERK